MFLDFLAVFHMVWRLLKNPKKLDQKLKALGTLKILCKN